MSVKVSNSLVNMLLVFSVCIIILLSLLFYLEQQQSTKYCHSYNLAKLCVNGNIKLKIEDGKIADKLRGANIR